MTIDLLDPDGSPADPGVTGSVALEGEPPGTPMGRVVAGRGHMTLLPAGRCHRFSADRPSVILLQTIEGPRHRLPLGRHLPDRLRRAHP